MAFPGNWVSLTSTASCLVITSHLSPADLPAKHDYIKNELTQDEYLGELIREKLIYYPTVTREAFKHTGRLTTAIESGQLFKDIGLPPLDPAVDRAMICGSPSMLKETAEMLDAKGFKVSPSLGQMGDYVFERAFVEK